MSSTVFSDAKFSGTSAACPMATGLIATVLQYNRSWTWSDVRNWLQNSVQVQDTARFYVGTESTTANAATWSDVVGLEGAAPRVLYNAFSIPISNPVTKSVKMKGNFKLKGNISIKFKN
jgi:subtilisin family serine protease